MSSLNYQNPGFRSRGFEFLDENIFIKKNVLSNQYMEELLVEISNFSEFDWTQHGNYKVGDLPEGSFVQDKVSPPIDLVNRINDIITDLFLPEYWPIRNLFISRLRKEEKCLLQTVNKISNSGEKQFHLDYIITTPIGNWKGGEYFFPKKNITISLDPGDLLGFSGDEEYSFNIQKITEGVRYSSFIPLIKHPGWLIL